MALWNFRALLAAALLAGCAPAAGAAPPPARARLDPHGDPLPRGAVARLGTLRWRCYSGFNAPSLSPDGRWLVTARNNTLQHRLTQPSLWDCSTGKLVRAADTYVNRPGDPLIPDAFLPGGKQLLSLADDQVRLHAFPSFRLLRSWKAPAFHSLAVSPDGRLAAGPVQRRPNEWEVAVLDLRTGRVRRVYQAADVVHVGQVAFRRDGSLAFVQAGPRPEGASDRLVTVCRIDPVTGRRRGSFTFRASGVLLAPDGRHVACQTEQGPGYLYRVETGGRRRLPTAIDRGDNLAMAFRPDGRVLITFDVPIDRFGKGGRAILRQKDAPLAWVHDVDRGVLLDRVRMPALAEYDSADFFLSPRGDVLFFTGRDDLLPMSLRTGRPLDELPRNVADPEWLRWAPGGRTIVVAGSNHPGTTWDARTGRLLGRIKKVYDRQDVPIFGDRSPDGSRVAEVDNQSVTLYDALTGKDLRTLGGHRDYVRVVTFSPDGKHLASADNGGGVRVWDVKTGRPLHTLTAGRPAAFGAALFFAPDGRSLGYADFKGRVTGWDLGAGRQVWSFGSHRRFEGRVQLSLGTGAGAILPGEDLVLLSRGGLESWETTTGRVVNRFEPIKPAQATYGHRALVLSSDGRFLARRVSHEPSGQERATLYLYLYEVASGRILHRFADPSGGVRFHPHLPRLAVGNDRSLDVVVYDLPTLLRQQDAPPALEGQWAALARPGAEGLRAAWRMAATHGMEAFLDGRLTPARRPDAGLLARHIAALVSDRYATRQQAEKWLADQGDGSRDELVRAHRKATDLEQRRRLRRLLDGWDPTSPGPLRLRRAVLALETRRTTAARRLLERLAEGAPGALLTRDAEAALARLREQAPGASR